MHKKDLLPTSLPLQLHFQNTLQNHWEQDFDTTLKGPLSMPAPHARGPAWRTGLAHTLGGSR